MRKSLKVLSFIVFLKTKKKIKTSFVGKYETIEELRARARLFILTLIKQQHDQIAGTPLEPSLPLADGNVSKELG